MGYKIEIVLISIALFLCGCIIVCTVFFGNESEPIVVEKYISSECDGKSIEQGADEEGSAENQTLKDTATSQTVKGTKQDKADTVFDKININTACKEELMSLDGIGDVLSDRIIEYRQHTKFNTIDDIQRVKGIGEKTFEALKDSIIV